MKLSIVFRASPWLDRTILRKKFGLTLDHAHVHCVQKKNSHLCFLALLLEKVINLNEDFTQNSE